MQKRTRDSRGSRFDDHRFQVDVVILVNPLIGKGQSPGGKVGKKGSAYKGERESRIPHGMPEIKTYPNARQLA